MSPKKNIDSEWTNLPRTDIPEWYTTRYYIRVPGDVLHRWYLLGSDGPPGLLIIYLLWKSRSRLKIDYGLNNVTLRLSWLSQKTGLSRRYIRLLLQKFSASTYRFLTYTNNGNGTVTVNFTLLEWLLEDKPKYADKKKERDSTKLRQYQKHHR